MFNVKLFLNLYLLFIRMHFLLDLKKKKLVIRSLKFNRKNLALLVIKKKLIIKATKLKLEKLLYSSNKLVSNIYIQNVFSIFSVKKSLKIPKNSILWKNWKLFFFNDLINIFFFSVFFRRSNIFSSFIAKNITSKKMHFNFLKKIKRLLNSFFFYGTYCNLIGILIKVHGKFQGILRKRKFKHVYGKTSKTSFTSFVDYSLQKSYTKYGVFSIKVYLFYSNLSNEDE